MERALGFTLLGLGFLMLFGGIGLLIGGEITLKSGKKIPLLVGRKAGIALVSFFPIMIIVHVIFRKVDPDNPVPTNALYWPLALMCFSLAAYWLLSGMTTSPPNRGRAVTTSSPSPIFDPSPSEPLPSDSPAAPEPFLPPQPKSRSSRSKPRGKDPFDFS